MLPKQRPAHLHFPSPAYLHHLRFDVHQRQHELRRQLAQVIRQRRAARPGGGPGQRQHARHRRAHVRLPQRRLPLRSLRTRPPPRRTRPPASDQHSAVSTGGLAAATLPHSMLRCCPPRPTRAYATPLLPLLPASGPTCTSTTSSCSATSVLPAASAACRLTSPPVRAAW